MKWFVYYDGVDLAASSDDEKELLIKLNEMLDDNATPAHYHGEGLKTLKEKDGELILRLEN